MHLAIVPSHLVHVVRASLGDGDQLIPLRRGSFCVVPAGMDEWSRTISLHLARCVAISGRMSTRHALGLTSAARMHGLRVWPADEKPHFVVAVRATGRDTPDHHRQLLDLPEEDIVVIAGIPVLCLQRVAVDCARFIHPRDALVVVDHALAVLTAANHREAERTERAAITARFELLARLDRLPSRSRGRRRAKAVITWATPWSDSAWESHLRWIVLAWGRPDVVVQKVVHTGLGNFRTDLAIPLQLRADGSTRWLHIEFDGLVKYSGADPRARARTIVDERSRERAIEATGDVVVRFDSRTGRRVAGVIKALDAELRGSELHRLRPVRELAV